MKTYITRINGWGLRDKSHYMQHMVAETAHQLGCREMGIYRYNAEIENVKSIRARLDGIIAGVNREDLVICQFPTGNGTRFENELVNRLKIYGVRIAIFIHELESLAQQEKYSLLGEIINLYNKAEVLIVPTYAMRQWLLDNGIRRNMKFVVQEMWDYTVNEFVMEKPLFQKVICFTDSEGFAGMNGWNYSVSLKLYNVSAQGQNIQNFGEREPYQLFSELSLGGGFGLVWFKDEYSKQYMGYGISFSLARYLAAGIPVIVPVGISHRTMIEENHLGLVVNSLEEAAIAMEKITEEEYRDYVESVEQFAPAIRNGYYTKKCLIETMKAFYRKDAGRLPLPERVYSSGESVFRSVALNESYGGNTAFSWDFHGETEGFLIYDTEGTLLGHTRDIYQHYFLWKGQEKEKGFIVKAYVETLKGKLILAESVPVFLQKQHYGTPKVSIIIPAYNVEGYIARGIDTVLAQSQEDVEMIIVDDGSTDHTPEMVDWYAANFENVVAIHQENSGVAVARNTGIRYAKGEYIGFMDSDDTIRKDMVERLYCSAKKNDCDIAITSVYFVTDNERTKTVCYPVKEDEAIAVDDFFAVHSLWVTVVNKLYRSSLVKEHLFPVMPYEDDAWTPYILSYAKTICYLEDFSYEWVRRTQERSLSVQLSSRSVQEQFVDFKKAILFFIENGNPEKKVFLKEMAQVKLSYLESAYQYEYYGKLKNEIEEKY